MNKAKGHFLDAQYHRGAKIEKIIGTQGVQELFFCELKGFGDSRI